MSVTCLDVGWSTFCINLPVWSFAIIVSFLSESFFDCPGLVLTFTGLFNCHICNDNSNSGNLEDFAFLPAL